MIAAVQDDFDLDKIIGCGQCFRPRRLEDGSYLFLTGRRLLRIEPLSEGRFRADCPEEEWNGFWAGYFDLSRNYARIRRSVPASDPFLRRAAACGAGIRILRQDPWETLVTFLISQRKNIPGIRTSVNRLCTLLGEPLFRQGGTEHAFPSPSDIAAAPDEALSACGLGYRLPYVRSAAEQVLSGRVDPDALGREDGETLTRTLLSFRGVGKKVADCVSLFAYGRCDCAPVDVWIARMIRQHYGGRNPFCAYGDDAGILQQYMFYYAQLEKRGVLPADCTQCE